LEKIDTIEYAISEDKIPKILASNPKGKPTFKLIRIKVTSLLLSWKPMPRLS
jgi:hypothetical protein